MTDQSDDLDVEQITNTANMVAHACVTNARSFQEASLRALDSGSFSIAYHLGVLALEEIGKSRLFGMVPVGLLRGEVLDWRTKGSDDHVKKIFGALFGPLIQTGNLNKESLEELDGISNLIHKKRLQASFVEVEKNGTVLAPADHIGEDDAKMLVSLVNSRIQMEETALKASPSNNQLKHKARLLNILEKPENRPLLFCKASIDKLNEVKNSREWLEWLANQVDEAENSAKEYLQAELDRKDSSANPDWAPKWRVRIRLFTDSHLIKQKSLRSSEHFSLSNNFPGAKEESSGGSSCMASLADTPVLGVCFVSCPTPGPTARQAATEIAAGSRIRFESWGMDGDPGLRCFFTPAASIKDRNLMATPGNR